MWEGMTGTRVHLPTLFSSVTLSVLALFLCLGLLSSVGIQTQPTLSKLTAPRHQRSKPISGVGKIVPAKAQLPPKAGPKAVRHFVYACPPKTGSLITRNELRQFCRREGLQCLGQMDPCPAMGSCPVNSSAVALQEELEQVFWAAFTSARLGHCCPQALETQFDAAIFHPYLADPRTREFFRTHTPEDALWFTILRNPVDQFISFFDWVTAKHRHIYELYMPILQEKRELKLEKVVELWHEHLMKDRLGELPAEHLQLYRTISNIQARILGWEGTPKSLREVIKSLERMAFVGLTEEVELSWNLLRKKLHWPSHYLHPKLLRKPTMRKVDSQLRKRILDLQAADAQLYAHAKTLFQAAKNEKH